MQTINKDKRTIQISDAILESWNMKTDLFFLQKDFFFYLDGSPSLEYRHIKLSEF